MNGLRHIVLFITGALLFADPPDWTDGNPDWYGVYEFPATIAGGLVLSDGLNMAEEGDMFGAFDAAGNVRGIAVQLTPSFGPYAGQIFYEMALWSNVAGDLLYFKYYDASEDAILDIIETYEFVINDMIGSLIEPEFYDATRFVTLSFVNPTPSSVDIYYSSNTAISGFQFDIDGVTLPSASGGDAEAAGFSLSCSPTFPFTCLGFDFGQATIPAGSGTLLSLEFAESSEYQTLQVSDVLISDSDGNIIQSSGPGNVEIPTTPEFFVYHQSTQQAFYYFNTVTINGQAVEPEDWVGAFNGDVCVGARKWDTTGFCSDGTSDNEDVCLCGDNGAWNNGENVCTAGDITGEDWTWNQCGSGVCDVPAMGDSPPPGHPQGEPYETEGYMQPGDIPTFKIYDASENTYYDAVPSENFPWANFGFNSIDNLETSGVIYGCTNPDAANYNPDATHDDGSCCVDDDVAVGGGGCAWAVENFGCDFNWGGATIGELCPVTCETCGSGDIAGCTDDSACNYNADATDDDGSCSFAEENYDCDGNCTAGEDCAGVCGGSSVIDECGVCGGDSSSCLDCAGVPNGNAELDDCGDCNGGNAADLGCGCDAPAPSGCDNACGSTLENDECGVCGGDNSTCLDCAGVPNGDAELDDCGDCNGGNAADLGCGCGEAGPSGCDNACGSTLENDECGVCGGDNSTCLDCTGVPNGDGENCETDCPGGIDAIDCLGVCNGSATLDNCSICDSDPSNDCNRDCLGILGGTAKLDECGVCNGGQTDGDINDDGENCETDCSGGIDALDCLGVCNGSATLDNCEVCDSNVSNDCIQDCADVWGGDSLEDECGVCDNDATNDCVQDCADVWGGDSLEDECGVCEGVGKEENHDCDGNCLIDDFDSDGICDIDESNPWGDVSYEFDNITDESVTLKYTSNVDIYGFEFDVTGIVLTNVISNLDGISLSSAGDNVLGVSLSGSFLASGTGTAAILYFEPASSISTLIISNIIFAGRNDESNAVELSISGTNSTIIPACSINSYGCCGNTILDYCGNCGGTCTEGNNTSCATDALVQMDCEGNCGGSAVEDECGVCDGPGATEELPCYELIFSDDFTASNQVLSNSSSSNWSYTASNYSTINISNNKLVIKGSNDGYAHRIKDNVLSKLPYTKLIDKIEFSADIGHISYASNAWIYGIFISDQNSDIRYHFFFNSQSNGNLYWKLSYYDYESEEWLSIYDWESISESTYDISDINFKLTYESFSLNGYLNGDNIFNYGISNFQCKEFGIYSQMDGEMWVDNVKVYGRQVVSNDGLGRDSRRSMPMSPPSTPPIKD